MSHLIPLLLLIIPLYGMLRGVDIYAAFAEGARDGVKTAFSVFPYLATMLIAISILRESQALDRFFDFLDSKNAFPPGFPKDALPMPFLRALSGSASLSYLTDLMQAHGPDSRVAIVAACVMGSSETIFYTLSLYCGSAKIRKTRYALPVSLIAAAVASVLAFALP